jgi:hypothetical protein
VESGKIFFQNLFRSGRFNFRFLAPWFVRRGSRAATPEISMLEMGVAQKNLRSFEPACAGLAREKH